MNCLQLDKCTILKYSCLQTTMTCTPRLGVTQGHWKWLHSMDCVWLSINVQLVTMAPHYSTQLCRYLILKNTATGVLKLKSLDYHVVKTASSQVCFRWTYTQHHNITTIPITALSRPDVQWTFKESYTAIWQHMRLSHTKKNMFHLDSFQEHDHESIHRYPFDSQYRLTLIKTQNKYSDAAT